MHGRSGAALVSKVDKFLIARAKGRVEELKKFLRIPSVSADSRRKADVRKAAEFVLAQFRGSGLDAELVKTAGHPIVFGSWLKAPGAPTVLVYGHYDVQPPDPLDQWT